MAWQNGPIGGYSPKSEALEMAKPLGLQLVAKRETRLNIKCISIYRNGMTWFCRATSKEAWEEAMFRMRRELPTNPPAT